MEGDPGSFYLRARSPQAGDGTTIVVDEVVLTGMKGYVAVHGEVSGRPGPVLGASPLLQEGTTRNVRVRLNQPLALSANVFPMLHVEDNANTSYDFPAADAPAVFRSRPVELLVDVHVAGARA